MPQLSLSHRWNTQRLSRATLPLLAYFCCVLWLLFEYQLPGHTQFWAAVQNSGHSILFLGLSLSLLFAYRYLAVQQRERLAALWVLLFCALFGGGVEIAQSKVGRDGSWSDFYLDLHGAVAGCFIYLALFSSRRVALLLVFGAAALMGHAFTQPFHWRYLEWQRDLQLPLLGDFDQQWPSPFIGASYDAQFSVVTAPAQWRSNKSNVAKVTFPISNWPGFSFRETPPDWRRYQSLSFDVFNGADQPRQLVVRVHDKNHNNAHSDRFNRTYTIAPGETVIRVPLAAIESAPKDRKMDMANIQTFMLYVVKPKAPFVLYFDNFQLHQ